AARRRAVIPTPGKEARPEPAAAPWVPASPIPAGPNGPLPWPGRPPPAGTVTCDQLLHPPSGEDQWVCVRRTTARSAPGWGTLGEDRAFGPAVDLNHPYRPDRAPDTAWRPLDRSLPVSPGRDRSSRQSQINVTSGERRDISVDEFSDMERSRLLLGWLAARRAV